MYRVYLDWNVMTSLKGEPQGLFARLADALQRHRERLWIPYTSVHLDDLTSGYDPKDERKVEFTRRDLDHIQQLTRGRHLELVSGQDQAMPTRREPLEFFESNYADQPEPMPDFSRDGVQSLFEGIRGAEGLGSLLNLMWDMPSAAAFPENAPPFVAALFPNWKAQNTTRALLLDFTSMVQRATTDHTYSLELQNFLREAAPLLSPRTLSSAAPEQVYERIDALVAPHIGGQSLTALMNKSMDEARKDSKPLTFQERFVEEYFKLEYLGYRAETIKPKNHFPNIVNDANHAFFAGHCDFFVTNDEKLRFKAKAVYHQFSTTTWVCSAEEFVTALEGEWHGYSAGTFAHYIEQSLSDGKPIPSPPDEAEAQLGYWLPQRLFDFFNFYIRSGSADIEYTHLERTYSKNLHRDEFECVVNLFAHCLGEDDTGANTMQLPQEMVDINDATWAGRQWTFEKARFQLSHLEGSLVFRIVLLPTPSVDVSVGSLTG